MSAQRRFKPSLLHYNVDFLPILPAVARTVQTLFYATLGLNFGLQLPKQVKKLGQDPKDPDAYIKRYKYVTNENNIDKFINVNNPYNASKELRTNGGKRALYDTGDNYTTRWLYR